MRRSIRRADRMNIGFIKSEHSKSRRLTFSNVSCYYIELSHIIFYFIGVPIPQYALLFETFPMSFYAHFFPSIISAL